MKIFFKIYGFLIFRKPVRIHGLFKVGNRSNITIGNNLAINYGVYIQGHSKVIIGNNVVLSPRCMLLDSGLNIQDIENARIRKEHIKGGIHIGNNVWVGANAIILPGVVIGDNSIVGAGSVVTKTFPPNVIIAGNPAKIIKRLDSSD